MLSSATMGMTGASDVGVHLCSISCIPPMYLACQMFDVWDRPLLDGGTRRWLRASKCTEFVEDGLLSLYKLGGDFRYTLHQVYE